MCFVKHAQNKLWNFLGLNAAYQVHVPSVTYTSRCGRVGFPQTFFNEATKFPTHLLVLWPTHPYFSFVSLLFCLVLENPCRKHPTSSQQSWDFPQSKLKKEWSGNLRWAVIEMFSVSCLLSCGFSFAVMCLFTFSKRFVRRSVFYGARRNPTLTQRLWIWHIHIYLVYMHTSTTLVATASNWIKDPLIICQGVLLCSWKPNLCANGSSSGK